MATAKKTTKKTAKPATRPAARKAVAAKKTAPVVTATAKAVEPKADKPKKPKLVRDSFTMPKPEYAVLDALKARALKAGAPAKKSEVLRAAIKALAALPDGAFLKAMQAVPAIKTGRPAKV